MTSINTQLSVAGEIAERVSRAAPAGAGAGGRRTRVTGVVLAGVQQWGGAALDQAMPRPLVPVANRPLITYAMRWLKESGLASIRVCGNSHTGLLRTCLGGATWEGVDIEYYEDRMPRGPAGCVRDACMTGGGDLIVAVDGTVIPRVDLAGVLDLHERSEAVLTVVVSPARGGGARAGMLVPLGIYVFSRSALEQIAPRGYQDIKEKLIPDLYARGERVVTYSSAAPAPRVTGSDSYLAVNAWMVHQLMAGSGLPANYRREGEAWIHRSSGVHPAARIIGPVLIGPGCSLERGTTIVGPTSIGAYCTFDEGSVVCRSAVWDGCSVGRGSVLDRCILANGVEVRAGVSRREAVFAGGRSQWAVQDE